jgi:dTMP kinase
VGSSLAYQGHARGLGIEAVAAINAFGTDGLVPDLVVLLVVPEEVASQRMAAAGAPDRLEAAGAEFHRRVAEGYAMLAAHDPERWLAVDGTGTPEEVEARVLAAVATRLPMGDR